MPLQGNLGAIGLADVLQTALAGTRGGELVVTRGPERAALQLSSEGLFLLEPEVLDAEDVLSAFAQRGQLSAESLKAMRGGPEKSAAVLESLIATGSIPETQVLEIVAGVVEDTVLTLLSWREGSFRFQEGASHAPRKGLVSTVGVDLEGVLLRAAQRMDERRIIEQLLGAHSVLFRALEAPVPNDDPEARLEDVHAALDGRATTDEIALRLGLSRFSVLKAVARLVESGAARTATNEELAGATAERLSAKRLRVARELAIQWATAEGDDPEGVRALVRVAEARERPQEVAAALSLLGDRLLGRGEAEEALHAYQDALSRRPGDVPALEGLRRAADVAGDAGLWTSSTLRLAQGLLESDDPQEALRLANAVLERTPTDVSARLTCARACVQLKDREGMVAAAQALVEQLGGKAQKRAEREAAEFCRDAVALLAPERSDLLRNLRALGENRPGRHRRAALVSALVAIAATAGVLTWPASAGRLLNNAQEAVANGDKAEALQLIDRLIEQFPESEEAALAYGLQVQLMPSPGKATPATDPKKKLDLKARLPALFETLKALPAEAARTDLQTFVAGLGRGSPPLPPELVPVAEEALKRLSHEARSRHDALALVRKGRERLKTDVEGLRALLSRGESARDGALAESLAASLPGLQVLVDHAANESLRHMLRELQTEVAIFQRALTSHDDDLLEVRRLVAGLELEESHVACREQAARLLVAGRIDEADRLYVDLEKRLAAVAADKDLSTVKESADRRHLGEYVRDRRALVADIHKGLGAAQAAADSGDYAAAAASYQALTQRHYTVRFDDLIRVPLQLDSVPKGAEVLLNGKHVGVTPLKLDYPWGGPTTLTVQAAGFDPSVTLLHTNQGKPIVTVSARLQPMTRWSAPVSGTVEARPLDVGGDVLVCDRAGRLTLFAGADGHVLWTRHLKSLEGARARPALVPGAVVAAFLDGRLVHLDLRDGEILAEQKVERPVADLASDGDLVAVAVSPPAVIGVRRSGKVWDTPLTGHVSAGVLMAHGQFWIGTANGEVLRLNPRDGQATRVPLAGLTGSVVGLSSTPRGLLVTTSGGQVVSLTADGTLRWTAPNLGDLLGAAAEAAGRVVVTDRKGRVLLLGADDGSPVATLSTGRDAVGGVLARGDVIAAALSDGRLWVLDARTLEPVADAPLSPKGVLPPATLGSDALAVVTKDGRLLALPFVAPPKPSDVPAAPAAVPAPKAAPVESPDGPAAPKSPAPTK